MLLRYHGVSESREALLGDCPIGPDGVSALTMVRTARRYGLRAAAFRLPSPVELDGVTLPAQPDSRHGDRRDRARALLEQACSIASAIGMAGLAARGEERLTGLTNQRAGRRSILPAGLTAREAEVLRLIAAGRTNREIADELVLSLATVERHITNLYAKIDVRGRADATAFALRHALLDPAP